MCEGSDGRNQGQATYHFVISYSAYPVQGHERPGASPTEHGAEYTMSLDCGRELDYSEENHQVQENHANSMYCTQSKVVVTAPPCHHKAAHLN